MAAQFTATNGPSRRALSRWSVRATTSLPVPDSPRNNTVESDDATLAMDRNTSIMAGLAPSREGRSAPVAESFTVEPSPREVSSRPTRSAATRGSARRSSAPSRSAASTADRLGARDVSTSAPAAGSAAMRRRIGSSMCSASIEITVHNAPPSSSARTSDPTESTGRSDAPSARAASSRGRFSDCGTNARISAMHNYYALCGPCAIFCDTRELVFDSPVPVK